ncbi:helix-turn-helix domain-containing protein [Brevibacillus laterosporus]|uniref:helix-turn-helix transcriptional regulator n=1 Tax=Brevibacillus laterosporus TaxID=1465 RepID=UPI003D1DE106
MEKAQKLTSALADPTRFSIYQYVTDASKPVTVHEVAEQFSIHPNVARLHLTKLEDVQLLQSQLDKSGKDGRPSRLYSISDEVVSLQFPPRDYQLLADIAIESLLSLGVAGQEALVTMGKRLGLEAAKRAQDKNKLTPSRTLEDKLDCIYRIALAQGLRPQFEVTDDHQVRFRVFNCTFSEIAKKHPANICKMHHAMLEGIFQAYFGNIELIPETSMIGGCESCNYVIANLQEHLT